MPSVRTSVPPGSMGPSARRGAPARMEASVTTSPGSVPAHQDGRAWSVVSLVLRVVMGKTVPRSASATTEGPVTWLQVNAIAARVTQGNDARMSVQWGLTECSVLRPASV